MSIKGKLIIMFSCTVSIILILNTVINFYSTREILRNHQKQQMELMATNIANSIEQSQFGAKYVEDLLGDGLRTAAVAIKYALDPNVDHVTNEQLVQLSKELDVAHITLFKEVKDDIIGMRSSDPHEINLSTKQWGYWFTAFQQLFSEQQVTVSQGQKLPNYWAGPFDVSVSNPSHIDKWGYFYDGQTDYMINPYIRDQHIKEFERITGPQAILQQAIIDNPTVLEIVGFNPATFGKEIETITNNDGEKFVEVGKRPILFGNYTFVDQVRDAQAIMQANESNERVSFETTINNKRVIKSFIPVDSEQPYVIGLVTNYQIIQDVLNKQLLNNVTSSLILIFIVLCASYFLSQYLVRPIHHILKKVNEISTGKFGTYIDNDRKDELGLLAEGVNTMSKNLDIYTNQIEYQANYDHLTGLPNSRLFHKCLDETISDSHRTQSSFVVMVFDLDRFKSINDSFGHTTGDLLLKAIGERVRGCLDNEDKLFRIGGDVFTLILPNATQKSAESKANRIIHQFVSSFKLEEYEVFITSSIGISIYPMDGVNTGTLFKNADIALHHAKGQGKNAYQFFTKPMNDLISRRVKLEKDLWRALERKELTLYYQPQLNTKTGQICGVEALIRWHNNELGFISPSEFIPVAEETRLILPIGAWVLKTACQQMKEWQDSGYPPMRVSVNISSLQFQQSNLVDLVDQVLQDTKLDPQFLELEITEGIAMQFSDYTIFTLQQLKNREIHISMDDFGTGYSSLSYLKKFPIDKLKIDKSFVNEIDNESDNRSIITTIIAMAHNLKFDVIAEGVETMEQLEFLQQQQCYEAQGYLLSKPLSVDEFESRFLSLQKAAAAMTYKKD